MSTLPSKTVAKGAVKVLNALNNWITLAVVMTIVAIFPAFRFLELSRLSYRLREEDNITADWAQAEAWAWGFGAMISIITALFFWGMVREQMRRRRMLAAKATACNCDTDSPDICAHAEGCQYREFLYAKTHEVFKSGSLTGGRRVAQSDSW